MTLDLGRYLVFDEIASGGMASVHFGRMLAAAGVGRTVAIKRLHPQFAKDPHFVTMMVDEARVVSRIHHPNVVSIVDIVPTKGDLFLVMEYVAGETLARIRALATAAGRVIPEPVALAIVTDMLHGLDAAHEAMSEDGKPLNIIHRDVSPQNVIVGVDGHARMLDFGIARAADASHFSEGGELKGKVAYMAPEQLQMNGELGRTTDTYAASVVLWEVLTGQRLYGNMDRFQIARLVMTGAVRSPRSVRPSISEELEEVVMRGLDPDPERRFPNAREMSKALEACGRVASTREVAELVSSVAAESIAARASIVARIEKETAARVDVRAVVAHVAGGNEPEDTIRETPSSAIALPTPNAILAEPRPGGTRALAVIAACAVIAFILGGAFIGRRSAQPHERTTTASEPPVAQSAPPVVAPRPTESAPAPSAVGASSVASTEQGTPVAPPTPRRREAPGARGKPRPAALPSTGPRGDELFERN